MHQRSHRKCHFDLSPPPTSATVRLSVSLSRTIILAFTPLLFSASIRRLAATAAPPVRSLVFTISTRIVDNVFCLSEHKSKTNYAFFQIMGHFKYCLRTQFIDLHQEKRIR